MDDVAAPAPPEAQGAPPEAQGARRWGIAVAIVVVLSCAPMALHPDGFLSGDAYRDNDWLTDRLFDLLARGAILDGSFPLRSPMVGGGYPTLGHPFDGSWAPTLLAILLLGPVWGVKLNLLLITLLGAWGMGRLARDVAGMRPEFAAFAALAFALSGWLPGMMLVGFYPQAFVFVVPAVLALLLAPRTRGDPVLAGVLLFLLFQQGGNAFVAAAAFLFVAVLVLSAPDRRSGLLLLGGLLLGTAGLALGRRYALLWPSVVGPLCGAALLASPWLREARAALRGPLLALAGVLVVTGTLGVGKAGALLPLMKSATYAHVTNGPPSDLPLGAGPGRAVKPGQRDEHFYNGVGELLEGIVGRAPREGTYQPASEVRPSPVAVEETDRRFATREYQWLGFTPGLLLLAAVGAARRRGWPFALLAGSLALFLLGPHAPGDLYLLVAGGLPLAEGIRQPVKYYNVYLLLCLAVLAGLGAEALARRMGRAAPALALLLVWPLAQNAPIWADRFAEPLPAWECAGCVSVKQIGHPSWVGWDAAAIEQSSRALFLREQRRPPVAREYDNALHGVRTIDWYGTLALPEPTVPSHYVTPTGTVLANPHWQGDAWVVGRGELLGVDLGVNAVTADVRMDAPGRVVVNQAWRRGFVPSHPGRPEGGLLAADLPAGTHHVSFRYRPWGQIAGLAGSAVFAGLWGAVWWRRRGEAA